MNERIKTLRIALGLTQKELGERVGVKDNAISRLESGERNVTEQMLLAICRTFNVNEAWLRHGEGDMFDDSDDGIIAELARTYRMSDFDKKLVMEYLKLSPAMRQAFEQFLTKLVNTSSAELAAELAIDREGEDYKEQLRAELKGETSSVLPDTKEA